MTAQTKSYVKNNWMTLANLIILLTIFFRGGYLVSNLESGVKNNRNDLKSHEENIDVHLPFSEKIKVFVPRVELDSKFDAITKQLDRIEKKLN